MSTFLELCQELRSRAPGIAGQQGQPTSVLGQTGDMANVVSWVRSAWVDLQALEPHWLFMRGEFSGTVAAGTAGSTATELGVSDLADWRLDTFRLYPSAMGKAGDQYLIEWGYEDFRDTYLFGPQVPALPSTFAIRPRDKAILLGPVPSEDVVVYGEYQRAPQTFVNNTDTPTGLPAHFHQLIVYLAMEKYAGFEAAPEIMADARIQRASLLSRLRNDWLPNIGFGEPLA
jgi:hypothetical protein